MITTAREYVIPRQTPPSQKTPRRRRALTNWVVDTSDEWLEYVLSIL